MRIGKRNFIYQSAKVEKTQLGKQIKSIRVGGFVKKSVFDRIWTNNLTYSGVEILLWGAAFGFLEGRVEALARTKTGRFCDRFDG